MSKPGRIEQSIDQVEVLASTVNVRQVPVTLAVDAGVTLEPGTILGRITASGKYGAYDGAAGNGLETATGVLEERANIGDSESTVAMYRSGTFINANLVGLDAAAIVDLGATLSEDGAQLTFSV